MVLSKSSGSESALGIVNAVSGLAMVGGSILVSLIPSPKSRVRIICNSLLLAMSTENFFLAFGKSVPVWCIGAFLGWIAIPFMNANMDVFFRNHIPLNMQGRVYSARNTLQFFTIPIGYFLGGFLVDKVFEPVHGVTISCKHICYIIWARKRRRSRFFIFMAGIYRAYHMLNL